MRVTMILIQKGPGTTFDKNKLASSVFILQMFTHFVTFHTTQLRKDTL